MSSTPHIVKGARISPKVAARKPLIDKALFAERLRVALAKKDWSPTDLARHLQPPPTRAATNAWASSRTKAVPSGPYAAQLPQLLGVEAAWLFPAITDEKDQKARPLVVREPRAAHQRRPRGADSPRILSMKEAAARIAKSLDAALRKSEVVIDANRPQELERQRALVWALKDLARQLKRGGYNMDELFDLTDEMAAELGLPPHPPHKE